MAKSDDGHEVSSSKKPATPKAVPRSIRFGIHSRGDKDQKKPKPVRLDSPRWLVPLMLALFGIGLIWIVVYYVASGRALRQDAGAGGTSSSVSLSSQGFHRFHKVEVGSRTASGHA